MPHYGAAEAGGVRGLHQGGRDERGSEARQPGEKPREGVPGAAAELTEFQFRDQAASERARRQSRGYRGGSHVTGDCSKGSRAKVYRELCPGGGYVCLACLRDFIWQTAIESPPSNKWDSCEQRVLDPQATAIIKPMLFRRS